MDQPEITCPMECEVCTEPGDCEDCLDCLYWPEPVTEDSLPPSPVVRGYALPTKTTELVAQRAHIVVARRVGLLSRRFRRLHRLTQRELAARLGWSRATVGRMEVDASALPFGKVVALVEQLGYRIALVSRSDPDPLEDEVTDASWGVADLLALDAAGRRPPPASTVTWNPEEDRRQYTTLRGREWTWHREAG